MSGSENAAGGPQRRCVVCRRSAPKSELLRLVWRPGGFVWDREQRMEGRGAYIHAALECWSKMADVRLWNRVLERVKSPRGEYDRVSADSLRTLMRELETALREPQAGGVKGARRKPVRI